MSTMTPTGSVEQNIMLAFDFAQEIVEDPQVLEDVPSGATLVLLPDDNPSLTETNLKLAMEQALAGKNVYLRHVQQPSHFR